MLCEQVGIDKNFYTVYEYNVFYKEMAQKDAILSESHDMKQFIIIIIEEKETYLQLI